MTTRNRIIIWAGIIIGLVLASLLFYTYIRNKDSRFESVVTTPQQTETQGQITPTTPRPTDTPSQATTPQPSSPEDPEDTYLKQLARLFVERLGSYSNQNENEHIDDILSLATPGMISYLDTLRLQQQRSYEGSTTRVITSNLSSRDERSAIVTLGVQQEHKTATSTTRMYKNGRVELIRDTNSDWKISGVYWEE